ncbi:HD-GYP domain-containing protein [Desulforamulus ferrireducens]|uniref:Phosphohydrolase n=1 Tax=Desulforamulus ferrireducens TaxID=1833852 RepID=A0A1S6ISL9_9FIRM|nr:HD domain-containing phosphohydrolase [Desulforamulus ferrireducens]AQS57768.1 phosphohydrolase [Desulforamulus ferrireducens]
MDSYITNYYKLLSSLSLAMDFSSRGLLRHHQRVALIALQIGRLYGLNQDQMEKLFTAAILHDAGSSTWQEKQQLLEYSAIETLSHCQKGFQLFHRHPIFHNIAEIILYHHERWDGYNSTLTKTDIPIESRIIHLADRIDVLIKEDAYILGQKKHICQTITAGSGKLFDPLLVEAFSDLSERECFWLDLHSEFVNEVLSHHCPVSTKRLGILEIASVAQTMSKVIDFKSPYTRKHSAGVAQMSYFLGQKAGFTPEHCDILKVAGLLHDLGKLGIPDAILDKPGKLTADEFDIMRKHTYYTYHILNMVDGFETINHYASCHHEKLNGRGYPFKLDGQELKTGARIVAVADIFTALTEDRPYRPALDKKLVMGIISDQVKLGHLDGELAALLLTNYEEAQYIRQSNA